MRFASLLGLALVAETGLAHVAVLPPFPDRRLTPNSSEAPEGCKYLPSDKGYPDPKTWKAAFPDAYKKMNGTYGPDWMLQPTSIGEIQKAIKFAKDHNVRFAIVSTGHDFGGRSEARSGIRIDMNSMREPTVFSNTWTCGKKLAARHINDEEYHGEIVSCKVPTGLNSMTNKLRNNDFRFFQKREGFTCDDYLKLHKRQIGESHSAADMTIPEGEGHMPMMMGELLPYNVIKPTGDHAYARVSGGMYNEQFFTQASKSGLMTLGAQHGGVSVVGGWLQFGGHNPFANRYGLAADNVVEFEVVLADGRFVKASECENPDLYWALRGGGGSTFGVVTGITTKVFPTFPVAVTRFFVNGTHDGIMKAAAHFLQRGPELRDKYGLQGYFYVYPKSFQSVLHMPDTFATKENAKAVTDLIQGEMEKIAETKLHTDPNYYFYPTYKDWYVGEMGDEKTEDAGTFLSQADGSGDDGSVPSLDGAMRNPLSIIPWYLNNPSYPSKRSLRALNSRDPEKRAMAAMTIQKSQPIPRHYLDSRLLSDKMVNSVSLEVLAKAIKDTMPDIDGSHYRGFLYGGGEWAKKDPESTGLNPVWRDATYHFIINAVPGSSRRDYNIGPIAKLFPDAGAYVNEASPLEPDWKKVFWGVHYDKLEKLKQKYDPDHIFWCSPCVGADYYTYDDERMCKNPNYPEARGVPPPDTYPNANTKVGLTALPGVAGIDNPLLDVVTTWSINGTLPSHMLYSNYFKMAMGEGGSAGGKYKDWDPYNPGQKFKAEDWEIN